MGGDTAQERREKMKQIVITLRSPKGAEWELKADEKKLETVKRNAKKMGYKIVKVGA